MQYKYNSCLKLEREGGRCATVSVKVSNMFRERGK